MSVHLPRTSGIGEAAQQIEAENQILPREHHGTKCDFAGVQRAAERHHPFGTDVGIRSKRKP
jgi:hypothetical protein